MRFPTVWYVQPAKPQISLRIMVPTGQGKVREICFFFKVSEKSGNFVKWSGKFGNLQKSGKSQGILKSYFNLNCSNPKN